LGQTGANLTVQQIDSGLTVEQQIVFKFAECAITGNQSRTDAASCKLA
jgi:hypothetical protein